jgi:lipopolysaccharide export system permease protein
MRFLHEIVHRLGYRGWTLDYYTCRRFVSIFLANICLFSLLYTIIDALAKIEDFVKHSDGVLGVLGVIGSYYFYTLPEIFCRVLGPVTTMASGMFCITLIQRGNEIVPVLASGISLRRLTSPIVLGAATISAASFAVQEQWIPSQRQAIQDAKAYNPEDDIDHPVFVDSRTDIVAVPRKYHPHEQKADGMLVMGASFLLNVGSAQWIPDEEEWLLTDAEFQSFDAKGLVVPHPNPDDASLPPVLALPIRTIRLNKFLDSFVEPGLRLLMKPHDLEDDGGTDVYSTLAELREKMKTVPDLQRWRTRYYARLADPLHHIVLILLGIPVILWQGSRNVFLSALLAVLLGAGYFTLQTVTLYLGNESLLAPEVAAWLMPITFGTLGLTLYTSMRT